MPPCGLTAYRLPGCDSFLKIIPAPIDRFWMDFSTHGWANRCLPLRVANQAGWHLLNDCDFEAVWNGKPALEGLQVKFPKGQRSPLVGSNFGYGILTWFIPYLFRTSPGYNLLVRGPANSPKDGIYALDGLVETDWLEAGFTMNWKFTRPFKPVRFHKDEPIALILPQRRGELEEIEPEIRNLESEPDLLDGFKEWSRSRTSFAAEMKQRPDIPGESRPWQGHYTRGTTVRGQAAPQHQTKLELRPFLEREAPLRQPTARVPSEAARESGWKRLVKWAARG